MNESQLNDHALDTPFEEFWQAYPRKDAKGAALKAFRRAVKREDVNEVIAGAKAYATLMRGTERRFIAMPASWLNADRWADEQNRQVRDYDPLGATPMGGYR